LNMRDFGGDAAVLPDLCLPPPLSPPFFRSQTA